ncbi:MAG: T9SS type A sorting domain-containing protein [Bacteroidales bacterium]|nr:T9SS type A sorting domain-containing protein [Bacteroidales bacterium]
MKKELLSQFSFFLFALLISFQATSVYGGTGFLPVAGTDCNVPFTAVKGINHSDHTGVVDQWFTYTATSNCLITVSSCGYTTKATSFYVFDNCSGSGQRYSRQCGTTTPYQSQMVFEAVSGQTYLIKWLNLGAAESYDWSLTESPLPTGTKYSTAIPAIEGNNSTYHYGNSVDQWYSFSPNVDGMFELSYHITGFMMEKVGGILYLETSEGVLTQIAKLSDLKINIIVAKGKKYYLRWSKDNSDLQSWSLNFQPMALKPGDMCESPITAIQGINSASNVTGSQWFSYIPAIDGVMTVSTCGMTTEDTRVYIYDGCNVVDIDNSDDDCGEGEGFQTEISVKVTKDTKYLTKWVDDYTSDTYNWNLSMSPFSNVTDIKSFSFAGITTSSTIDATNHTINVVVGKNVDKSSLIATFNLSAGASTTIGTDTQESGITSNNFSTAKTYTIIAEDNTTKTDWTVTVTNASDLSSEKAILTYTMTSITDSTVFDAANHNIKVYIPYTLSVNNLVAQFTLSNFATVAIGATTQISGSTPNDFTTDKTYTITAENGTTQNWVVQVITNTKPLGETCSDPKIAVEGVNHSDKVFSPQYYMYTPTQTGYISLTYCGENSKEAIIYSDCSTSELDNNINCGEEIKWAVEVGVPIYIKWYNLNGDSWTLTQHGGLQSGKQIEYISFMGGKMDMETPIDQINHTISAMVEPFFNLSSIMTQFGLSFGAKAYIGTTQIYSDDIINFTNPVTITVKAQDGGSQDYLVTVTHRPLEIGNSITSFALTQQTGQAVIDSTNHTVKLGVASGTVITNLIPRFTLSLSATAKIGAVNQSSGQSFVDFTNPVVYSVKSEEVVIGPPIKSGKAVTQDWTVTVTVGTVQNIYADITSIRLNEQTQPATIDIANKTITFLVAQGTDRSALIPTFYLSSGATAKIGTTPQVSGVTSNNFTTPLVYAVTSEDGLTTNNWTVKVKNTETSITSFSLPAQISSTIDPINKTIAVVMPQGSNITSLVSTFTLSTGATAKVATMVQTSGVTANNFTNAVVYVITAEDGVTIQNWTVNVSVASGINENPAEVGLDVYPNPSNGIFHVKLNTALKGTIKLDVFSVTGAMVMSKFVDSREEQIIDIDLTGKQTGVYYVRIQFCGERSTLKLILK